MGIKNMTSGTHALGSFEEDAQIERIGDASTALMPGGMEQPIPRALATTTRIRQCPRRITCYSSVSENSSVRH